MDIETIMQLIGNFGFPIVCCCAMGWYVKYTIDKFNQTLADMTAKHAEESKATTEALNANTVAIEKLSEKLGKT